MRGFRAGLLVVALAAFCGGEVQAGGPYLRGSQLADLYSKYSFCYDHLVLGGRDTCTSIEDFDSQTPSVLRIASRSLVRFRVRTPNSVGDLVEDMVLSGTIFKPQGYELIDTQTHDISADGLCRSKQTVIQDDYLMQAVLIADLSRPGENRATASQQSTDRWKFAHAQADQNEIGNEYCFRYTVYQTVNTSFGPPRYLIGEDEFIDGARQPDHNSTATLYPKGTYLTLRMP